MTKEEWAAIEKELSGTFGSVKLKADGHEVTFYRGLVGKNRLGIVTYVDGWIRGEWIVEPKKHPESKYLRPDAKYLWSRKERLELKKMSKLALKQSGIDPDKKFEFLRSDWPSVTAIRRHYEKNFENIELIIIGGEI